MTSPFATTVVVPACENRRIDFLKRHLRRDIFHNQHILEIGDVCISRAPNLFRYASINHHGHECNDDTNILHLLNTCRPNLVVHWNSATKNLSFMNTITPNYMIMELEKHSINNCNHLGDVQKDEFETITLSIQDNIYMIRWKRTLESPLRTRRDRIAMFFSGRIKTYESQLTYLINLQNQYDIDCFCSINGENDNYHTQFLNDLYIVDSSFEDHVNEKLGTWIKSFRRVGGETPQHAYRLSSSLYNNAKCMDLIRQHQDQYEFTYDIIIKFRADIVTNEMLPLPITIDPDTIYIPEGNDWRFEGRDLGINDQIAYGSFDAMQWYCSLYPRIEMYCQPPNGTAGFHPESLLYFHLIQRQPPLSIVRFALEYSLHASRST